MTSEQRLREVARILDSVPLRALFDFLDEVERYNGTEDARILGDLRDEYVREVGRKA